MLVEIKCIHSPRSLKVEKYWNQIVIIVFKSALSDRQSWYTNLQYGTSVWKNWTCYPKLPTSTKLYSRSQLLETFCSKFKEIVKGKYYYFKSKINYVKFPTDPVEFYCSIKFQSNKADFHTYQSKHENSCSIRHTQ